MKIKQYIVTYNNELQINNCLKSILNGLSQTELNMLEINIINNHTNFNLHPDFIDRVNVLHNVLRPDFSTGHLSRNWNQAIINGFKDLNNPDCDVLITNQDDTKFQPNYINHLIEKHKEYDLIQMGHGDNLLSYTPTAIKRIGLWDERFCNIGFQEADYFLRAALYHTNKISLNDKMHARMFNELENNIIEYMPAGYQREEPYHKQSMQYHHFSLQVFIAKWGYSPVNVDNSAISWDNISAFENKKPLTTGFIFYPYFEKDIETLKEQNYLL
jgi:hypothetical protein